MCKNACINCGKPSNHFLCMECDEAGKELEKLFNQGIDVQYSNGINLLMHPGGTVSTVSKTIADELVKLNGYWPGDPQVIKIVEYDNAYGGIGYGLVYNHQNPDTYKPSHWVRNPRVYWEWKT